MEYELKKFSYPVTVSKLANIHYFEFTNKFHTTKGCHAFRELLYVDSDYITVNADNYNGMVKENQLIIHQSNETHSLHCPETGSTNIIIIGFECNCDELDEFSKSPITLNDTQKRLLTEVVK